MEPSRLLEQFLTRQHGSAEAQPQGGAKTAAFKTPSFLDRIGSSGLTGIAGGLAAGGLLGVLIGNKKARKTVGRLAGGVAGYGGAAALGALAYRAYQNWSDDLGAHQAPSDFGPLDDMAFSSVPANAGSALPSESSDFLQAGKPASDGRPFELALVTAMVAAANADGHIGPDEQQKIFSHVAALPLDAEDKAFVFDALKDPPNADDVASLANGIEQATEIYLASLLAADPNETQDRAYLDDLSLRLALPDSLIAHLEDAAFRRVPVAA